MYGARVMGVTAIGAGGPIIAVVDMTTIASR
jgi:hypothetical protein